MGYNFSEILRSPNPRFVKFCDIMLDFERKNISFANLMFRSMKITVIGGGNMGGAIALGALKHSVVGSDVVTISHLAKKVEPFFTEFNQKIRIENNNAKAVADADMIVVAVKPWLMEQVLGEISDVIDRSRQVVVSIAAGLTFAQLSEFLHCKEKGGIALYRVIPNTAIAIGQSVTLVCRHRTTEQQDAMLFSLFDVLGKTFLIDESEMVPLTSLSSCGIAFIYKYIDASIKGAVEMGLDESVARDVVLQTVRGSVMMLEQNGTMPQTEIDKVTTPGGITLKGLEAMEQSGFSAAVINGLKASR